MARPDGRDAGLVIVAAVAAPAIVRAHGGGLPEQLFGAVVLAALTLALRSCVGALTSAWRQGQAAAALRRVRPDEVARTAIQIERERLSRVISAELRSTLVEVGDAAHRAVTEPDPRPAIAGIHHRAQVAAGELHLQLGLLRTPADLLPSTTLAPAAAGRDIGVTAACTALAVGEAIAYPLLNGQPVVVGSVVTTALAASTLAGRRRAPLWAATALALSYLVGAALAVPVIGGFWFLGSVCGLIWTMSATLLSMGRTSGAIIALTGAVSVATWFDDPDNLALTLALMLAALGLGLGTHLLRQRERVTALAARDSARQLELVRATSEAAEREAFARDLHDTVSHAIGLIAVQAAAAQVSWSTDPLTSRRALGVIEATTVVTLKELDRDNPIRVDTGRQLPDLVQRIQATGTRVNVEGLNLVTGDSEEIVYRVVQESLTNVLRHCPGAAASVVIRREDNALRVVVSNDLPSGQVGDVVRGYGLLGLAERVRLVGGVFTAGSSGHSFAVEASLPPNPTSIEVSL